MKTDFFYLIVENKYLICDSALCANSDRAFDINLHDIANNRLLLNALELVYIGDGNNFMRSQWSYERRAKWFCGYLSSFSSGTPHSEQLYNKALTNPVVRLLIVDDNLLALLQTTIKECA